MKENTFERRGEREPDRGRGIEDLAFSTESFAQQLRSIQLLYSFI
jgi:hypothetical protein